LNLRKVSKKQMNDITCDRDSFGGSSESREQGFSLIEVAIASLITMIGLVALGTLFTLAMSQNKMITQFTATTAIAQQKLEELNAIEQGDGRLVIGGGLDEGSRTDGYFDDVYVDPRGIITTDIPDGQVASYRRFWQVEADPELPNTLIVSVRVAGLQPARGRTPEETTLTTVRSW
jgi:type II secretory pathway pseudopilin PulG